MRRLSCVLFGLILSATVPGAASAGGVSIISGHRMAPPVPVSGLGAATPRGPGAIGFHRRHGRIGSAFVLPKARVIQLQGARHFRRGAAFGGVWAYAPAAAAPTEVRVVETSTGDYLRPPPAIYYLPAPPLAQGDVGYVAHPAIYSVSKVLREHPLGRSRHVVRK